MGKHIMINDARCSFPQLYKADVGEGGQTFNPGITVVLEPTKHAGVIRVIKETIAAIIAAEPKLKAMPPKGEKLCLRTPDREELLFDPGNLMLKTGNPKPPVVMHRDQTRMTEADDKIYSGCRVNIKVDLWGQVNKWGKRVNAKLLAVQFNRDDESFDGSYVSEEAAMEGFSGSLDDAGDDFLGGAPAEVDPSAGDDFLLT